MTTAKTRKRKRPVDSASVTSATEDKFTIMQRDDPSNTLTSFHQVIKMLHAFLEMCHNNDSGIPNRISDSVYNIITMQVNVLETLMKTLQEHMK